MQSINALKTRHLKIFTAIFGLGFLLSVFKVSSLILLSFTLFFAYLTCKRIADGIIKKGLKHYIPEKWKKRIGDKTIVEFLCDRKVIEGVPILNVLMKSLFSEDIAAF